MLEKKFWGTFEVSMDEMVRVQLPAKLRKQDFLDKKGVFIPTIETPPNP